MRRQGEPAAVFGLVVLLAMWPSAVAGRAADAAELPSGNDANAGSEVKNYALLVGCTTYPLLSRDAQLAGPANDVELMATTLHDRFALPEERIIVLSEAAGAAFGEALLPTRENIRRNFEHLAETVRPGDRVVILLAGHGSQQPEPEGDSASEPDGLDEIFLPRDVGVWDSQRGTVVNAILDDEIGSWLAAIVARKARVWIVFDSCHSGTMVRGAGDDKLRQVDPAVELRIPEQTLKAVHRRASQTRGNDAEALLDTLTAELSKQGGLVAIYAAQPNEVTVEGPLPPKSTDARPHGLLTYALCQAVTQTAERSAKTMTYAELAQRVMSQYVQWGRTYPTPLVEGVDRDREILGEKTWAGRSQIVLARSDKGFQVTGGALHGLTLGSVLAVYPPPGQGEQILGHVRIVNVRTLEADVEPCEYGEMPMRPKLPAGGVCRLVYRDFGDQLLKVAVAATDFHGRPIENAERRRVQEELEKLRREGSLVAPVEDVHRADWLLRSQQGKWLLMPAAGLTRAEESKSIFGPVPVDHNLAAWLSDRLGRIARAENVLKLAAASQAEQSGDNGSLISVRLEIRRARNISDKRGNIPVEWPQPSLTFHANDLLIFRITNTGQVQADVTILYVDSSYGVTSLFPQQGELNRLQPGETFLIPPVRITSETTGLEHMIVLALKSQGQPVDFSGLEQPRIEEVRTRGLGNQRGFATPLGLLLQASVYGQGSTRGLSRQNIEDYSMQLFSWRVSRQPRPGAEK